MASVLHVCDISAGIGPDGKPVDLTDEMDGGMVVYVVGFPFHSATF